MAYGSVGSPATYGNAGAMYKAGTAGARLRYEMTMGAIGVLKEFQGAQTYEEALQAMVGVVDRLNATYKGQVPKDSPQYAVWQSIVNVAKPYLGAEANGNPAYSAVKSALHELKKNVEAGDALGKKVGEQVGSAIETKEDCVGF